MMDRTFGKVKTGNCHGIEVSKLLDFIPFVMQEIPTGVKAERSVRRIVFTAAESKARPAVIVQCKIAFQQHSCGTCAHVRQRVLTILCGKPDVVVFDLDASCDFRSPEDPVLSEIAGIRFRCHDTKRSILVPDELVVEHVSCPLIESGIPG